MVVQLRMKYAAAAGGGCTSVRLHMFLARLDDWDEDDKIDFLLF